MLLLITDSHLEVKGKKVGHTKAFKFHAEKAFNI
jgi:hypothetical protein